MTIENVKARITELQAGKSQVIDRIEGLETELAQLKQNKSAFNGALEDCQYWLSVFENEENKIKKGE
jgi:FtsZ-binding cell division protein ZapB